jgi:hypothetical protein
MPKPMLATRLTSVRWTRNLNATCGTNTRANTLTERHTTVTLGARGEAAWKWRASNDVFRYTTEELHNITTHYATGKEVAEHLAIPASREATPGNSKAAPSKMPRRAPRAARRGASSVLSGL